MLSLQQRAMPLGILMAANITLILTAGVGVSTKFF
jgi:hypothetical protein